MIPCTKAGAFQRKLQQKLQDKIIVCAPNCITLILRHRYLASVLMLHPFHECLLSEWYKRWLSQVQAVKTQWHLAVEKVEARDRKVSFNGTTCTNGSGTLNLVQYIAVAVLEDDNTHNRYATTKVHNLRISSHCFFLDRAIFATF